ncbi:MAG: flagellar brake protein [Gammaproteobacteria bacterium]|nr:flagellar brake protein [Gammaproteobacteria bacterium]
MVSEKLMEGYELVDSRPYILLLLQQLMQQESLLEISYPRTDSAAVSTLLRIDSSEGVLVFDRPYLYPDPLPNPGGEKLMVSAHSQANHLLFETTLVAEVEEEGMPCTLFRLPQRIRYYSSRADHRIDTSALEVTLVVSVAAMTPLVARLRDISARGVYINLDLQGRVELNLGDVVGVEVLATSGCSGEFRIKVVRIQNEEDSMMNVGGEAILENSRQQMQLVHLVACLERTALRKQHGKRK